MRAGLLREQANLKARSILWTRIPHGHFASESDEKLWWRWVLASTLGLILAGLGLGLAQWLVLRRRVPKAERWIWHTPLGLLGGMVVLVPLFWYVLQHVDDGRSLAYSHLVWAFVGGCVGLAQWLALRWHFTRAGWWIAANAVGWAVAWLSTWLPVWVVYSSASAIPRRILVPQWLEVVVFLASILLAGAVLGAITGATLVWLSRIGLSRQERDALGIPASHFDWKLLPWWVLASTVGVASGVSLIGLSRIDPEKFLWQIVQYEPVVQVGVSAAVVGAIVGVALGAAQWLVLRQRIRRAGWLVLANTVGLTVGNATASIILLAVPALYCATGFDPSFGESVFYENPFAVSGIVGGAVLGFAQWLVLRRHFRRAGWWVLVSMLGWAAGVLLGRLVGVAAHTDPVFPAPPWDLAPLTSWDLVAALFLAVSYSLVSEPEGLPVVGVVVGVVTGLALVWLLRRSSSLPHGGGTSADAALASSGTAADSSSST